MVACLGEGPSVAPTPKGNKLLEPTPALVPLEGNYEGVSSRTGFAVAAPGADVTVL